MSERRILSAFSRFVDHSILAIQGFEDRITIPLENLNQSLVNFDSQLPFKMVCPQALLAVGFYTILLQETYTLEYIFTHLFKKPSRFVSGIHRDYQRPSEELVASFLKETQRALSSDFHLKSSTPAIRAQYVRTKTAVYVGELIQFANANRNINEWLRLTANNLFNRGLEESERLTSERISREWVNTLHGCILNPRDSKQLQSQLRVFVSDPPIT